MFTACLGFIRKADRASLCTQGRSCFARPRPKQFRQRFDVRYDAVTLAQPNRTRHATSSRFRTRSRSSVRSPVQLPSQACYSEGASAPATWRRLGARRANGIGAFIPDHRRRDRGCRHHSCGGDVPTSALGVPGMFVRSRIDQAVLVGGLSIRCSHEAIAQRPSSFPSVEVRIVCEICGQAGRYRLARRAYRS